MNTLKLLDASSCETLAEVFLFKVALLGIN